MEKETKKQVYFINGRGEHQKAEILHWGIHYSQNPSAPACHYTVVFLLLEDGSVTWTYPGNLLFKEE